MQDVCELPRVARDPPVWRLPNSVTYGDRRRNSPVRRRVRRPPRSRSNFGKSKIHDDDFDDDSDDDDDDDHEEKDEDPDVLRMQKQRLPDVRANSRGADTPTVHETNRRASLHPGSESNPRHFDGLARDPQSQKDKPAPIHTKDSRPNSRSKTDTPVRSALHRGKRIDSLSGRVRANRRVSLIASQVSDGDRSRCEHERNATSILADYTTKGDREELLKSSLTLRLESQMVNRDESLERSVPSQQRKKMSLTRPRPATSCAAVRSQGRLSLPPSSRSRFALLSSRLDGCSFSTIASEEFHELAVTKDSDDGRESEEFDTDCEPDVNSDFRHQEYVRSMTQHDSDIGHITYETVCERLKIKPRSKVKQQLREKKLDLHHGALLPQEAKAISSALQANTRVEEVDLSHNSLPGKALESVIDVIATHIYISKLNLCGNVMDEDGSNACCTMLSKNSWLTELNLAECSIGDTEISLLAQGIQENQQILTLNLSKNKIGLTGGLVLGRALGINDTLKKVDLSWNHIRGGGAVSICNSLKKNTSVEDLNLAWNGIGFEGSLALGEGLRLNRTLKFLNLENNRINWDCAPYLTRALMVNKTLEVLVIGQNPISMDGCEDLMLALTKPTSGLRSISLAGIPINTRIALIATDIAKTRSFSMDHGGILTTTDVIGSHRSRREDPFSLLIRYLSLMGIRVMDLFRMFDKDNKLLVSRNKFIQGLKRVRVPLDDDDILKVAKRLQSNKRGQISYQELATTVRNHIREDRMEDRRQKIIQKKKREERKRILESGKTSSPYSMNYLPTLYNMYDRSERDNHSMIFSPSLGSFSRRGFNITPLPVISSENRKDVVRMVRSEGSRRSPSGFPRPGRSFLTLSGQSPVTSEPGYAMSSARRFHEVGSPHVDQLKRQQTSRL